MTPVGQLAVPVAVTLTWQEAALAAWGGVQRHLRRVRAGDQHAHGGAPPDPWQAHIEGCTAELVVAKYLDAYWTPTAHTDHRTGDVAGIGVRWTERDTGCLILHHRDPPAPFVLVTGSCPSYTIRGWLHSDVVRSDAAREWWRADIRHPAFLIPQDRLRDVSELRRGRPRLEVVA